MEGATGAAMPNPWSAAPPAPRAPQGNTATNSSGAAPFNPFGAGLSNPWGGGGMGGGGTFNPWNAQAGGQQPNLDQMLQMLENPMVSQMMNEMVQNNPDMLRQMVEAQNPMLAQMFQGNPEMANNFIRNAMNPENLRQMIQMQQQMGNVMGPGSNSMTPPNPMMFGNPFMMPPPSSLPSQPAAPSTPAGGSLDFSNLLQQFQGLNTSSTASSSPPSTNPADRYRVQLRSLYDMGFDDEQACLAALEAVNGNLNRAVDNLLSTPAPATATSPESRTTAATEESSPGNTETEEAPVASKNPTEKKND